jgi:hypothetical protein
MPRHASTAATESRSTTDACLLSLLLPTPALLLLSTLQLAIDAGDESVYPGVVDMLSSQGRMKYLRPLYRCGFHLTVGCWWLCLSTQS